MESKEELKQQEEEALEVDEKPKVKIIKKTVQYCQVCTQPPEFCMYQSNTKLRKCQEWLKLNNPALFVKFYVEPELKRQAEEAAKAKEAAGESAPAAEGEAEEKKENATVVVPPSTESVAVTAPEVELTPEQLQRQELLKQKQNAKLMMALNGEDNKITILSTRRKFKKFVTVVTGLSKYGVSLKEAAKRFRHKYACGAKEEGEEVEIQGEVDDVIAEFICKEWKQIPMNVFTYKKDAPVPKKEATTTPAQPEQKKK